MLDDRSDRPNNGLGIIKNTTMCSLYFSRYWEETSISFISGITVC